MNSPFKLPRTLKGADGLRYINMPGVTYPDSVLKGPGEPGSSRTNPLREPPEGYVSSDTAARRLEIAVRSARALLTRHKVHRVIVHEPGKHACAYWCEKGLNEVISQRAPVVPCPRGKYCSALEACLILSVARSSLSRYAQRGLLDEYRVRLAGASGTHCETFFIRKSVRHLANKIFTTRARMEEQRRKNIAKRWQEYQERLKRFTQGDKS